MVMHHNNYICSQKVKQIRWQPVVFCLFCGGGGGGGGGGGVCVCVWEDPDSVWRDLEDTIQTYRTLWQSGWRWCTTISSCVADGSAI